MRVFCVHSEIDQSQTRTSCVVRQCRRHGPSITYKITPCWVTLHQPARRAAVLGQPSSLQLHWAAHLPPYRQSFSNNYPCLMRSMWRRTASMNGTFVTLYGCSYLCGEITWLRLNINSVDKADDCKMYFYMTILFYFSGYVLTYS